ncbi:MAG TPA: HAD family hydrolase [Methylomirabilota bacterium]|nr:HAD family hydrolase [Methylomirabilota bacterium]
MRQGSDLILFDCDGVLVDSEIVSFEVEAEALAELGAAVTARDLLGRFVGTSSAAMFATVARENGIGLPPGFAERTTARCLAAFDARLRPVAGIAELLADLAGPRCVASSSDPPRIRHCLSLAGILHHFEPHIFSATQVRHGKPAPDLFLFAAERMGARPKRCVVVEDSVAGVTAARAAGMTVLGLTAGSHCLDGQADRLRQAGAAQVFASCPDLARHLGAPGG